MDISGIDSPDTPQQGSTSSLTASVNISSPIASVWSRGQASRSSTPNSSIASSPLPRDSFDLYGTRLGKVTEEPQEKDEMEGYTLVNSPTQTSNESDLYYVSGKPHGAFDCTSFPVDYSLGADHDHDKGLSGRPHSKRQRSAESPASAGTNRFSRVSSSISRRWRSRSGAGPQLSIVTHMSAPGSRTGSNASSQVVSPALSAISRHESCLPPSPGTTTLGKALYPAAAAAAAIIIPLPQHPPETEGQIQATTPLLPPVFTELGAREIPIHSPLQSPSIAPTQSIFSARTSMEASGMPTLPSPPLSTKASIVSMRQRSRANTTTASPLADIPPLQLHDETDDPWAQRLGHANFNIHPEPYIPELVDLDSYQEFRANWDQARANYAKHLARTNEHYGVTSKVYKLSEEKWSAVDGKWKNYNESLTQILRPVLAKLSDADTDMQGSNQSSAVLEKPVSRVVMPEIDDKCGKFPELGDEDIVGPMAVGPPRNITPTRKSPMLSTPPRSPTSPRKRNLFKFFSDILNRS